MYRCVTALHVKCMCFYMLHMCVHVRVCVSVCFFHLYYVCLWLMVYVKKKRKEFCVPNFSPISTPICSVFRLNLNTQAFRLCAKLTNMPQPLLRVCVLAKCLAPCLIDLNCS